MIHNAVELTELVNRYFLSLRGKMRYRLVQVHDQDRIVPFSITNRIQRQVMKSTTRHCNVFTRSS